MSCLSLLVYMYEPYDLLLPAAMHLNAVHHNVMHHNANKKGPSQSLLPFSFPTRLLAVGHNQINGHSVSSLASLARMFSICLTTVLLLVTVVIPPAQPCKNTLWFIEVNCRFTAVAEGGSVVGASSGTRVTIGNFSDSGTWKRERRFSLSRSSEAESGVSPMKSLVRSFSPVVPMVSTISRMRRAASSVHTRLLLARAG